VDKHERAIAAVVVACSCDVSVSSYRCLPLSRLQSGGELQAIMPTTDSQAGRIAIMHAPEEAARQSSSIIMTVLPVTSTIHVNIDH
jgi:hypothetical protein